MIQETNICTYQYPSTLQELIDDSQNHPEMYKHLQIIFGSKVDQFWGIGQEYLVTNHNGYGIYILNDLDYRDGKIFMTFTNSYTGVSEVITMDINDNNPKHYFVKWADIKTMAREEQNQVNVTDELLELDSE